MRSSHSSDRSYELKYNFLETDETKFGREFENFSVQELSHFGRRYMDIDLGSPCTDVC